jgi:hypothetical protein
MNSTINESYKSNVCLKSLNSSDKNSALCCRTKGHAGSCSEKAELTLFNCETCPDRFMLEAAIYEFIERNSPFIPKENNSMHIACLIFDLVCCATMISEMKHSISWVEELDQERRIIFGRALEINTELKKVNMKLFSNFKALLCPVLGKKQTISSFVQSLIYGNLEKSNLFLSNSNLELSAPAYYSGPQIIPITPRGTEIVGPHTLFHNPLNEKNWRTELKQILSFNPIKFE